MLPLIGALIATRLPDPFHADPRTRGGAPPADRQREAVRPGAALALGSIGYGTIAAFVVLHLEARGVGHGATVFGAFATMVVLTRLSAATCPTGSARPGWRSPPPASRRSA